MITPPQPVGLSISSAIGLGVGAGGPAGSRQVGAVRSLAELTTRKLRRSAHRSVTELEADIRTWINEWNKNPKPFVWAKTADEILETLAVYCKRILDSGHSATVTPTCAGGARTSTSQQNQDEAEQA
jgi:hypothetical protein